MTKYQKYFQEMFDRNAEVFEKFSDVHSKYITDPDKWQDLFNEEGKKAVTIIREWERRLCQHSERGQYGKFSSNLAEKFWGEVRIRFPKIDFVGVKLR
jgi:hypothetical protein